MGINYNIINKATFYDENLKVEYNLYEYKNNLGFFISYEYLIWKIISLNIKYKFSKVNNIDKEIKQEKYKGFMLSLKLKISTCSERRIGLFYAVFKVKNF